MLWIVNYTVRSALKPVVFESAQEAAAIANSTATKVTILTIPLLLYYLVPAILIVNVALFALSKLRG